MERLTLPLLYFLLFLNFHSHVFSSSTTNTTGPQCHPDETSALLQLKSSFSIDHTSKSGCFSYHNGTALYIKTTTWNKSTNCCTWDGITCDRVTGHVIGLDLSCSRLQGTVSSNSSLFFLSHLRKLDLSFVDFRGSPIIPEFGQFKNLTHLDLFGSNFSGQVPMEISHLSKLVYFELSGLGDNKIKIEAATFRALAKNLTNLRELSLFDIDLSHLPPFYLVNLSFSLSSLYLSSCQLHGQLPEDIFKYPKLQELTLFDNEELSGSLPKSNWSSPLRKLGLFYSGFSIDLAHLLKGARYLSDLSLSRCHFVGPYFAFLRNLTQLVSLTLSSNNFSGHIPWSYLNLKRLQYLDLSSNNLIGQLPEVFNNSTQNFSSHEHSMLTVLRLSRNFLNGTIPSWINALPNLEELDLSNNQFTGEIGEFQSSSLYSLSLSQNKLHGLIPMSVIEQEKLIHLDLSSNNFIGNVELEKLSKSQYLMSLDLSSNNLSLNFNDSMNYHFDQLWFLRLSSCNISEFPNFLRYSTFLEGLDLSYNQIRGSVPKWLWELGKDSLSSLNLSHNFLTYMEPLPWNHLRTLDLRSNSFSGPLPFSASPPLDVFLASKNQFEGKIPTSFCNMTSLQVLDLSDNNLSGNIPQCMGNFSRSLSVFDLQRNKLSGTMPTTFAMGNSLRTINLNGNHLEGSLTRSLVHCRSLEVLDLGSNMLNDTFPDWLESLPELRVLVLRSNRFHGSILNSKSKFPFRELRIMDLSHNDFRGALPTKYFENFYAMMKVEKAKMEYMGEYYYQDSVMVTMKGFDVELVKIQTILTTIDFSSNNFTGEIPDAIGRLKSLKGLNFSHNKLRGTIPSPLGNLSNLEWLDLSFNEIDGEIPVELADLTYLAFLNLSHNQLVGPIPHGKQFNTFENTSSLEIWDCADFLYPKHATKTQMYHHHQLQSKKVTIQSILVGSSGKLY